jgi:hypothetical protein
MKYFRRGWWIWGAGSSRYKHSAVQGAACTYVSNDWERACGSVGGKFGGYCGSCICSTLKWGSWMKRL